MQNMFSESEKESPTARTNGRCSQSEGKKIPQIYSKSLKIIALICWICTDLQDFCSKRGIL